MGNKKRGHLSTVEKSRQGGGALCSVRVPASSCAIALITIVHNWQKFLGHTDCKFHLLVEHTPLFQSYYRDTILNTISASIVAGRFEALLYVSSSLSKSRSKL